MTTTQDTSKGSKAFRYGEAAVGLCLLGLCAWVAISGAQQSQNDITAGTTVTAMTQVMGRPTNSSLSVSVLAPNDLEVYAEYGTTPGNYSGKTGISTAKARVPVELSIDKLQANTRYYYRLRYRENGTGGYTTGNEYSFQTQRPPGSTFVFGAVSYTHLTLPTIYSV